MSTRDADPAKQRRVKARGHLFGPSLHCACGEHWDRHQEKPVDCCTPKVSRTRRAQENALAESGRFPSDPLIKGETDG